MDKKYMNTEPNIPAYPTEIRVGDNGEIVGPQTANNGGISIGLTKREYFASLALTGLSNPSHYSIGEIKKGGCVDLAECAILIADELIRQLNNG